MPQVFLVLGEHAWCSAQMVIRNAMFYTFFVLHRWVLGDKESFEQLRVILTLGAPLPAPGHQRLQAAIRATNDNEWQSKESGVTTVLNNQMVT